MYYIGKLRYMTEARLQLVLPHSHRSKAMAGCHDLVGHLGQDRVLELLRDRFFWPGMHMDVASYINSCPRCIRRKTQPDTAPLLNIEATQSFRTCAFRLPSDRTQQGKHRKCIDCYRPFYKICPSLSFQIPDCFGHCQTSLE